MLHAPIADVVERHVRDERLRTALHGQGCIGTFAGPREPGTAWIHAHHTLGLTGGWSFVEGGMGRISMFLAGAARDAGAEIVEGLPVAAIIPGEGVALDDGTTIHAPVVVSNADPVRTLGLLDAGGAQAPAAFRARIDAWDISSPVVKLNCALSRLPDVSGCARGSHGLPRPGGDCARHRRDPAVLRAGSPR